MLPFLLSMVLIDEPLGWSCSAQRLIEDRRYILDRSVEGSQRSYFGRFRIDWLANQFSVERSVEWSYRDLPRLEAPRSITLSVPVARRTSRATLRIMLPDGTDLPVPGISQGTLIRSANQWQFLSLDADFNRQLWAARNFRAVVEDRRGRVLGSREISFPNPGEVSRLSAELASEVEPKINDPANPAMQCSPYGEEAYVDPV
jgi:hypothetical protein